MLVGKIHAGSGCGDQLFRYITVRTVAEENGFDFGFLGKENFKADSFLKLEWGLEPKWEFTFEERRLNGVDGTTDCRSYDPEINFIEDNTIIDGSFEDSKYWGHNLENINKWLAVEPLHVPDDTVVLGFRGGEYYSDPNLGLPKEYYEKAMSHFTPKVEFQVHTDDPKLAMSFFHSVKGSMSFVENEPISHSKHTQMGFNWRSARYAKHAIIPNSAFFILPRLLKHFEDPEAVTVAPRGWSRRNLSKGKNAGDFIWARPACFYPQFFYI